MKNKDRRKKERNTPHIPYERKKEKKNGAMYIEKQKESAEGLIGESLRP